MSDGNRILTSLQLAEELSDAIGLDITRVSRIAIVLEANKLVRIEVTKYATEAAGAALKSCLKRYVLAEDLLPGEPDGGRN